MSSKICRCQIRTLTRSWVSSGEVLHALIQTLFPPCSPSHTSAKPPYVNALSPGLTRSPVMKCEDGRTMWWPQMARNLRKHCRKTSSEGGMMLRVLGSLVYNKGRLRKGTDARYRENLSIGSIPLLRVLMRTFHPRRF